jgi:pentatricopeptide repeat protein
MSSATTMCRTIRENLGRAKSCFRRHDPLQGLRLAASSVERFLAAKPVGTARYEIEVEIDEVLAQCGRDPDVRSLLAPPDDDRPVPLKLERGRETALLILLESLIDRIAARQAERKRAAEQRRAARRSELDARVREFLDGGDPARARIFVHRLLDEFGEERPDMYVEMSRLMVASNLEMDAAEVLEKAILRFPRETSLYSMLIDIYADAGRYELAEGVYRLIYKQFGLHPRTMINQAKAYYAWGRRLKAVDVLLHALEEFPDLAEVRQLLKYMDNAP